MMQYYNDKLTEMIIIIVIVIIAAIIVIITPWVEDGIKIHMDKIIKILRISGSHWIASPIRISHRIEEILE